MADSVIQGNYVYKGQLNMAGATVTLPSGTVANANVAAGAAIAATKLQHRHKIGCDFGLDADGVAADSSKVVFVADAACTIQQFTAKLAVAETGAGSASFDLKKNGTTVLSATVDIASAQGTTEQDGTVSTTTLAAGDILTMVLDQTSITDGAGPFAYVVVDEAAA